MRPALQNPHRECYDTGSRYLRRKMLAVGLFATVLHTGVAMAANLAACSLHGGAVPTRVNATDGTWSAIPVPVLTIRNQPSCIYDPARQRMVLFGVRDDGTANALWSVSLTSSEARQETPSGTPPTSWWIDHSAIYDPVRDRMIVFRNASAWALSLSGTMTWTQLSSTGPPVTGHSAVYDPVRDRMLVFGGLWNSSFVSQTVYALSLSGSPGWTSLTPTGGPPQARYGHSAIYDPVRDRMVVFGGFTGPGGSNLNDTWSLSLSGTPAWTLLSPSGGIPTARSEHTAIYDPAADRMLIFAGVGNSGVRQDLWSLSLSGTPVWTVPTATGVPPSARGGQTAIYDAANSRMVVFGGTSGSGTALHDVFRLSLAGSMTWTQAYPGLLRSRSGHTGVYDRPRDRMVVFGGGDIAFPLADTWELRGSDWFEMLPTGVVPAARTGATAVHDPFRDRMLVFGGADGSTYLNDTWALAFGGSPAWSALAPDGSLPGGRYFHTAIYDPTRDRVVVFAGWNGSTYLNDVWVLSLGQRTEWRLMTISGTPPAARASHSAVYDPDGDRMLVFGGNSATGYKNDLWALSFAGAPSWTPVLPGGTIPAARGGHVAIYDPERDRMLVFGGVGSGAYNEVQSLALGTSPVWTQLAPLGVLPGWRESACAVYDAERDRMLVFGGRGAGGTLTEMWALTWGAPVDVQAASPPRLQLSPAYPNPSRGDVKFDLDLPAAAHVYAAVYDVRGRLVCRLTERSFGPGRHALRWDGDRDGGFPAARGIYYCRVRAGEREMSRPFALMH